ncbi:MAG: sodium:calcium antiporter, partial [Thermoplasmatota archaeon]
MLGAWLLLVVSFVFILLSSELFTRGVEWLGWRLRLHEGAVGSVLAAVGTALPETMIPIIAVAGALSSGAGARATAADIGIGAILGAPFLLATIALGVIAVGIYAYRRKGDHGSLKVDGPHARRDLRFFLLGYSLAAIAAL